MSTARRVRAEEKVGYFFVAVLEFSSMLVYNNTYKGTSNNEISFMANYVSEYEFKKRNSGVIDLF